MIKGNAKIIDELYNLHVCFIEPQSGLHFFIKLQPNFFKSSVPNIIVES